MHRKLSFVLVHRILLGTILVELLINRHDGKLNIKDLLII
jgi:hypothetical protein